MSKEPREVTAQLWVNDKLSFGRGWDILAHPGVLPAGTPKAGTRGLLRLSWAREKAMDPFNLIHKSPASWPVQSSEVEGAGHIFKLALQGVCWA